MRIQCAQRGPPNLAYLAQRCGYCKIFGDCLRARTRPVDPNRRRAAHQQFSAMATGVYRTLFTDTFWPDFNAEAFAHALHWYRSRERRFGSISAQREAPAYSAKAV